MHTLTAHPLYKLDTATINLYIFCQHDVKSCILVLLWSSTGNIVSLGDVCLHVQHDGCRLPKKERRPHDDVSILCALEVPDAMSHEYEDEGGGQADERVSKQSEWDLRNHGHKRPHAEHAKRDADEELMQHSGQKKDKDLSLARKMRMRHAMRT